VGVPSGSDLFLAQLTNPVYGGAYAYGKTEHTMRYENGEPHRGIRRKPREQWLALLPNSHEGYVSWEQFQQITPPATDHLLARAVLDQRGTDRSLTTPSQQCSSTCNGYCCAFREVPRWDCTKRGCTAG
jgi:Recombinase